MDELAALLRGQDGLLSREQALAALSPSALRHRLRPGGPWRRVLPAVYAAQTGPLLRRQQLRAALLHGGPDALLTAATAAELHGLRAAPRDLRVHLLLPHARRLRPVPQLVLTRSTRAAPSVRVAGLPSVPLARAVVDACRPLRSLDDVRALVAESVQRGFTDVAALRDELEAGHSAGSLLVRRVLQEVADGVRSAPEARLRLLLRGSRVVPPALWNCRLLLHGRWLADPDGYWHDAGLVVECDSQEWHLSPRDWRQTLQRHSRMTAAGLQVLHVTPQELRSAPARVLAQIEAAYLTALRSGPVPGITAVVRAGETRTLPG